MWLGISGVGSIVVISTYLLTSALPLKLLPGTQAWSSADGLGLLAAIGCLTVMMLPLDLLGGFLLPNRSRPQTITGSTFLKGWIRGIISQATLFLLASLLILAMGRLLGLPGALTAVFTIGFVQVAFQLRVARLTASLHIDDGVDPERQAALAAATAKVAQWGWKPRRILVLENDDTGFTGGVVGLPGMESVVLPSVSLAKLTPDQLAVTIARRMEAIESGSRTRGMMLAFVWVLVGFAISACLPGAGVTTVGELVMTCCGFTLWTFLGLLTLPTLSRQASYAIDRNVMGKGVSPDAFHQTVQTLDQLQDDEPKRSKLIETIFHPVPSVDNRRSESSGSYPIAWHAARMTLFVSWACMGMLVRAVHCNAGRPELWVMLPTD